MKFKKLALSIIFSLVLLFIAIPVSRATLEGVTLTGVSYDATPTSGACATPSNGDEFDEGFLGTGYENSWAETIGAGGSIDEDFTLSGSPNIACCSEGLNVIASGTATYARWDKGSPIDLDSNSVDIVAYLYFDSVVLDVDQGGAVIWPSTSSTEQVCGGLFFRNDGGTYKIYLEAGAGDSAMTAFSEDTWYKFKIHYDPTRASSYLQINDGAQLAFTRLDNPMQMIHLGAYGLNWGSGESADIEVGYIYVDKP